MNLSRRQDQTVGDSSSIFKIDYTLLLKNFSNQKGHQNCLRGDFAYLWSSTGSAINGATPSSLYIVTTTVILLIRLLQTGSFGGFLSTFHVHSLLSSHHTHFRFLFFIVFFRCRILKIFEKNIRRVLLWEYGQICTGFLDATL